MEHPHQICILVAREAERPPMLLEEYTYLNFQRNDGLSDADFSPTNPAYTFRLKQLDNVSDQGR